MIFKLYSIKSVDNQTFEPFCRYDIAKIVILLQCAIKSAF
jgi:hypothetical protein